MVEVLQARDIATECNSLFCRRDLVVVCKAVSDVQDVQRASIMIL